LTIGPSAPVLYDFSPIAELIELLLEAEMKTLVCWTLLGMAALAADNPYRVITKYAVGGDGSWDYITVDSEARRLYVTHGTRVEVLDADTGKSVGVIADTPGVHGVVIARGEKRGFSTNGGENKVSVFDSTTLALIKKLDVGKGPDAIFYDVTTNRVFTTNHGSDDMTVIDAAKAEVVGTIKIEGAGESMARASDGLIYINLEDKAEVAAFDPKTLEVKHRYPIGVAKTPTGLAYDRATNRLFIGCRETPMLVVMDAGTGKVVANYPIGAGVDWAVFDPESKTVFASSGDGTLSVYQQKSADVYEDLGRVTTQTGAKTMAFDPKTKKIFLPTAEFEAPAAGGGRRKVKPGSFSVVVVGK
jgi:YVTN family beta-propeller protein